MVQPLVDREEVQRDISSLVEVLFRRLGPARKGELAAVLGMPASSLSHALSETGKRRRYWQTHEVKALSLYYDVPLSAFFGDPEALEIVRETLRVQLDQDLNEDGFVD